MEFKDVLKQARKEKNISQQELADAIFVSRSAIAKWENGLGLPNEDSLELLMEYFNVDREYFFPEIKPEEMVEKNIKIRKREIISNIAFAALSIIAIVFMFELAIGRLGIFKAGIENEYVDYVLSLDGYYVAVYEDCIYSYTDSNGENNVCIGAESGIEEVKDSLNWKTKDAMGVVAYKRWGIFYNRKCEEDNLIYLKYKYYDQYYIAGLFFQIEDNNNLYHYFYNRGYSHPIAWDEIINIEINGVKQELSNNYYFTSTIDLRDKTNNIIINNYELVIK